MPTAPQEIYSPAITRNTCNDGYRKRRRIDTAPYAGHTNTNHLGDLEILKPAFVSRSTHDSASGSLQGLSNYRSTETLSEWKCIEGLSHIQCKELIESKYFSVHVRRLTILGSRDPETATRITEKSSSRVGKHDRLNVTELLLASNDIASLREITSLHVERTFAPQVPDCVTAFSELTTLSWKCAGLTRFPQKIGQLKSLQSLKLHIGIAWDIPESLCDCESLQELFLLGPENPAHLINLPEKFGKLSRLRTVHIESAVRAIPPSCGALAQARMNVKEMHGTRPHREFFVRLFDRLYWHLDYHHGFRWCCTVFMQTVIAAERRVAVERGIHATPPEIWYQKHRST